MLRHHVQLYFEGGFGMGGMGILERPLEHRDPRRIRFQKNYLGFKFFDREEIKFEIGNEILKGRERNYSNIYYFGRIVSLDELKARKNGEKLKRIIQNSERYQRRTKYIKTRTGDFRRYEEGDIALDYSTRVK